MKTQLTKQEQTKFNNSMNSFGFLRHFMHNMNVCILISEARLSFDQCQFTQKKNTTNNKSVFFVPYFGIFLLSLNKKRQQCVFNCN